MSNTESSNVYYSANLSTLHVRSDYDPSHPENYQRLWEDVVLMAREHARVTTPKLVKNDDQAVEYAILYERDVDGQHSINEMWVGTLFHWRYNSTSANGKIVLQRRNKTLTIERTSIELRADDFYTLHTQTMTTQHLPAGAVLGYHWDRMMIQQLRREDIFGLPTSPERMIDAILQNTYQQQRVADRTGDELPMFTAVTQYLFRKIHRLNGGAIAADPDETSSWRDVYYGSHIEVVDAVHAWYGVMTALRNMGNPPESLVDEATEAQAISFHEKAEQWCDRHLDYLVTLVKALGVQKTLVDKFNEHNVPGGRHNPLQGLNGIDAGYYKQLMAKLEAALV